jgi:hypothetical protein
MSEATVRYTVVEAKVWRRDDGLTASIHGACPWTLPSEKPRWDLVTVGWTVRDNRLGTVGVGLLPWSTRAEAEDWVAKTHEVIWGWAMAEARAKAREHDTRAAFAKHVDRVQARAKWVRSLRPDDREQLLLDLIHTMDGKEWSADTAEEIAWVFENYGWEFDGPDERESGEPACKEKR